MLPLIFLVVGIIQLTAYKLVDQKKVMDGRLLVLIGIMLCYIFLFPFLFTRQPTTTADGVQCGMPVLALILAFWIFGCGLALITHAMYYFLHKKEKIYPED